MESKKFQKSYFDVLGLCCSSEVPLIEKILKQLDGIHDVNVIVPSRTVIVIHDNLLISQIQIVKALNQARLEANIQVYGQQKHGNRWPKPYTIICGLLVLVSLFKPLFDPLKWLAVGAVVVGIWPILLRSFAAVRNLTLDVNILVLIAVGGTLALQDYVEAGTIVFLFTIAEWLESRASHKANTVMSSLMSMAPQQAVLAETGQAIDAKDVNINTILAVKAGEVIPIDGIVVEGTCDVDEKTLTGESMPASKQNQSIVWAGTINLNGYISVKTTALAEDCVIAKMAKLVEEAQNSKSKTQRIIDECAKYYTPGVVLLSLGLVVVPAALRTHNLKHWLHLALVVLVSACPCALILSTPVATFCAFSKAATTGLLIKGGDYLETLAKIKVVAFDKTGTITRGEFSITDFQSSCPDVPLNTLLHWVSSIESKSSHPMASALVDYGQLHSIEPKPEEVKEFQNFPGEGIYGEIDGRDIYIGNKKIAIRAGCESVPHVEIDNKGASIGYIFMGATLVGTFSMADVCRSGVIEAIKELKSMGIKTAMLTGDSHTAAMGVQDQLANAIDEVHAELLPEEKVRFINDMKKRGPTAMVGDGVNDAPALATADIGISMGVSGSALATETGHITLMSNDIRKIPQAIRLARKTHWKIVQNVGVSIVTKAAILALAFSGHPILWAAVLADVGTCLVVICNSMLLLRGTGTKCHKSKCASKENGHSHNGCGHIQHSHKGCGSNNLDQCSHSNGIQEKCCSHDEAPNMCESTEDQACVRRNPCQDLPQGLCREENCMKSSSTYEGCSGAEGSSHAKHHGHGGCSTVSNASHVIQIASRDHLISQTSGTDRLGEESCSTKIQDMHANHSHEGLSKNHHHHHNHHHHQDHSLNDEVKTTSAVNSDCLHNGGSHIKCQPQSTTLQDSGNCTMSTCELMVMHVCTSLDTREIGGCCRSFRKECAGMHGCHGSGIGGLSEIIAE